MSITIYHNPRCSKSRKTLEIIVESGVEPTIVEYLNTPPGAETTLRLASLLAIPVANLLRRGEDEFKDAIDLPNLDNNEALAAWITDHPRVLERPIVVNEELSKAVIGRPPENVLEILGK